MAVLYITEYARHGRDATGALNYTPEEPPVTNQTVAIGGTTAPSNTFNALTTFVRIHTDAICSIEFGTAPTATTSTRRMAAGSTEYFAVPKGLSYKVAVISNS